MITVKISATPKTAVTTSNTSPAFVSPRIAMALSLQPEAQSVSGLESSNAAMKAGTVSAIPVTIGNARWKRVSNWPVGYTSTSAVNGTQVRLPRRNPSVKSQSLLDSCSAPRNQTYPVAAR